jgi:hypothetical protein
MTKYLIFFVILFTFIGPLQADKLLKSGFLTGEWDLNTSFEVNDPNNNSKILKFIESKI